MFAAPTHKRSKSKKCKTTAKDNSPFSTDHEQAISIKTPEDQYREQTLFYEMKLAELKAAEKVLEAKVGYRSSQLQYELRPEVQPSGSTVSLLSPVEFMKSMQEPFSFSKQDGFTRAPSMAT